MGDRGAFGLSEAHRPGAGPSGAGGRPGGGLKSADERTSGAERWIQAGLVVNGGLHDLEFPSGASLAEVLRDRIGLTGTKIACNEGHCGACTVLVDGTPWLACLTLAGRVAGREVTTIEGLREHPMVDAFVRADAVQCGFCTPGQIVSAVALVESVPEPSEEEIRHRMAGNLCRCGTYPKIAEAIRTWRH